MAKMTLDELRKLREQKQKEFGQRDASGANVEVVVGMGTCGIAAGAKEAFDAMLDEISKNNVPNVLVKQTGCMGLCYSEPTVEVRMAGMPDVVYGKVTAEIGRRIVREHILNKELISDHIYDKPAADIMRAAKA